MSVHEENVSKSRGLVIYDFLKVYGGAEGVAIDLAHELSCDLVFGYVCPSASGKYENLNCKSLIPSSSGSCSTIKVALSFIKNLFLYKGYDYLVITGFLPLIPLLPRYAGTKKIYFCHTPPRFAGDLYERYRSALPWVVTPLFFLFCKFVNWFFAFKLRSMDVVIANSKNIQARLISEYSIESIVVNPVSRSNSPLGQQACGEFYLSTARLEPYKRVDVIIDSFTQMPDKQLYVISSGSQAEELKCMSANAPNITFLGWVDEIEKARLLASCIATIYIPINEDFGMSATESLAAGKPVIGVNEGGLKEIVSDGETGLLLEGDNLRHELCCAVNQMGINRSSQMRQACLAASERYSFASFINNFITVSELESYL